MNIIDLRSDTVTKPTPAMLDFMFRAPVGDDVYEEDPTVKALEETAAAMFGLEAGLFCPSGTMTNQIAIKIQTEPLSEVICEQNSHIYLYEGGGIAFNSAASVQLVQGQRGKITPQQIVESIRPDNIHFPVTMLVSLENTCNKGGGTFYTLPEIAAVSEVCQANNLALHLDGARVFNALVASGESPQAYGRHFDTISVCLSKGLGAPVGSVLLGSQANIRKARRVRKALGGGMRQAGFLAAAGLFALRNNIARLQEDHDRAKQLGLALQECAYVTEVWPVETNIVICRLPDEVSPEQFLTALDQQGIKAAGFGPQLIRFVTHLDFSDDMLQRTAEAVKSLKL